MYVPISKSKDIPFKLNAQWRSYLWTSVYYWVENSPNISWLAANQLWEKYTWKRGSWIEEGYKSTIQDCEMRTMMGFKWKKKSIFFKKFMPDIGVLTMNWEHFLFFSPLTQTSVLLQYRSHCSFFLGAWSSEITATL